jgi:hypothetical protein
MEQSERLEIVNQELKEASEALVLANRRYVAAIELRIALQKEMRDGAGE